MLHAQQIRAARAMLRWTAKELAEKAGVSLITIQRMESAEGVPGGLAKNLAAVQRALEEAGIVFLAADGSGGPGVRLSPPNG